MTPDEQHELLFEMVAQWRGSHSGLRFGQWLWAVCGGDPFYVEDDDMVERMRRFLAVSNILDDAKEGDRRDTTER